MSRRSSVGRASKTPGNIGSNPILVATRGVLAASSPGIFTEVWQSGLLHLFRKQEGPQSAPKVQIFPLPLFKEKHCRIEKHLICLSI